VAATLVHLHVSLENSYTSPYMPHTP
jgi:hypothetical protein